MNNAATFAGYQPHGGWPAYYAERPFVDDAWKSSVDAIASGRMPRPLGLIGARGSGKTVELGRAAGAALESGILVVPITLRPERTGDLKFQLTARLASQIGIKASAAERKFGAKGTVPFTGIELNYEQSGRPGSTSLQELLERADASGLTRQGVAFMIDEGDFISRTSLEDAFGEIFDFSSRGGPIVTTFIAGTGYRFLYALRGESTFLGDFFNVIPLGRLTPTEATDFLVQTARMSSQDWRDLDLRPIISASRGIPRHLQEGAHLLIKAFEGSTPKESVAGVASRLKRGLDSADAYVDARTRRLIDSLDLLILPGEEIGADEFLNRFIRNGFKERDITRGALDWLFSSGRIEVGQQGAFRRPIDSLD